METIDVSAGLIFREGKLLITQRHVDSHLGGLWEFPGGKRERDESFEACLVRELREELGIEVTVGELVESLTHAYPEKPVHLRFYRCQTNALNHLQETNRISMNPGHPDDPHDLLIVCPLFANHGARNR